MAGFSFVVSRLELHEDTTGGKWEKEQGRESGDRRWGERRRETGGRSGERGKRSGETGESVEWIGERGGAREQREAGREGEEEGEGRGGREEGGGKRGEVERGEGRGEREKERRGALPRPSREQKSGSHVLRADHPAPKRHQHLCVVSMQED